MDAHTVSSVTEYWADIRDGLLRVFITKACKHRASIVNKALSHILQLDIFICSMIIYTQDVKLLEDMLLHSGILYVEKRDPKEEQHLRATNLAGYSSTVSSSGSDFASPLSESATPFAVSVSNARAARRKRKATIVMGKANPEAVEDGLISASKSALDVLREFLASDQGAAELDSLKRCASRYQMVASIRFEAKVPAENIVASVSSLGTGSFSPVGSAMPLSAAPHFSAANNAISSEARNDPTLAIRVAPNPSATVRRSPPNADSVDAIAATIVSPRLHQASFLVKQHALPNGDTRGVRIGFLGENFVRAR